MHTFAVCQPDLAKVSSIFVAFKHVKRIFIEVSSNLVFFCQKSFMLSGYFLTLLLHNFQARPLSSFHHHLHLLGAVTTHKSEFRNQRPSNKQEFFYRKLTVLNHATFSALLQCSTWLKRSKSYFHCKSFDLVLLAALCCLVSFVQRQLKNFMLKSFHICKWHTRSACCAALRLVCSQILRFAAAEEG